MYKRQALAPASAEVIVVDAYAQGCVPAELVGIEWWRDVALSLIHISEPTRPY